MDRIKFLDTYYYTSRINSYDDYLKTKEHFTTFDFSCIKENNIQYPCMFIGKERLDNETQRASIVSQSQVDKFLAFATQHHA